MNLKLLCLLAGALLAFVTPARAQIDPASSTEYWIPIQYGLGVAPDVSGDQQTGSGEGDIVGDFANPSLYMSYNNGGTTNLFTDDQLAFRFRLNEDKSPLGYKGVAYIGIDLNADGALDVFAGVNNSGSAAVIGLWWAGSSARAFQ